MQFDADYRERAVLNDGTPVTLRLLEPSDKPLLLEGFEHLSPKSRYQRFLGAKSTLSDAELRYLTELDQYNHFALGAVAADEHGTEHGLGVARFVRLQDRPDTAEPAIAVIDEAQGKGLGRLLFERLRAAARERDVTRFRSEILVANEQVRHLVDELPHDTAVHLDEDVASVELPLGSEPDEPLMYRIFRAIARATAAVRRRLRLEDGPRVE